MAYGVNCVGGTVKNKNLRPPAWYNWLTSTKYSSIISTKRSSHDGKDEDYPIPTSLTPIQTLKKVFCAVQGNADGAGERYLEKSPT
jgi:hypothetical protein